MLVSNIKMGWLGWWWSSPASWGISPWPMRIAATCQQLPSWKIAIAACPRLVHLWHAKIVGCHLQTLGSRHGGSGCGLCAEWNLGEEFCCIFGSKRHSIEEMLPGVHFRLFSWLLATSQGQEFVSASYDNTIRLWDVGHQRSKEAPSWRKMSHSPLE